MIYKKGDKGLVPQFINYRLGLSGDTFTEDTRTRVLQFQASYRNLPVDTTIQDSIVDGVFVDPPINPYRDYNNTFDPTDINKKYSYPMDSEGNIKLELYPNGVVDTHTMIALSDIDMEIYNERVLTQTQKTLSMTEFSNYRVITPTGLYDSITKDAIRNFQKKYGIGQQRIPIIERKNIFPNLKESWKNQSYSYTSTIEDWIEGSNTYQYNLLSAPSGFTTIQLNTDEYCILSDFIELSPNTEYYISMDNSIKGDYFIRIFFFKNATVTSTHSMITSLSTKEVDTSGFTKWVDIDNQTTSGSIQINRFLPSGLNVPYQINYIRIEVRKKNQQLILPEEIETLQIQLEKGNTPTEYEPMNNTTYNTYYSGFINIPTYTKLKQVYSLREEIF